MLERSDDQVILHTWHGHQSCIMHTDLYYAAIHDLVMQDVPGTILSTINIVIIRQKQIIVYTGCQASNIETCTIR